MQGVQVENRRAQVMRWAENLYSNHVDKKDAAGFAAVFSPTGWVRFGNNDKVVGQSAIAAAIGGFFSAFKSLSHSAKGAWLEGDVLFLEAEVAYVRHDDKPVTVPAMTVFKLASDDGNSAPVAEECRIFVDLTPLFAP
jgi:hypothetical protein